MPKAKNPQEARAQLEALAKAIAHAYLESRYGSGGGPSERWRLQTPRERKAWREAAQAAIAKMMSLGAPTPTPSTSNACNECRGTGMATDSDGDDTCQYCDGSGRKSAHRI